ncbi:MAG: hypothetical protein P4L56_29610 [Candidatus Sulfopaludibacter sp.]|nr:hypothetical protein [Candidatus Sulfopaludibacter sp.]
MNITLVLTAMAACAVLLAADFPSAEIANGQIRAKIYLPDRQAGYYRGTRFDWSGVVYSLQYKGHNYYGPWVQRMDPKVRDFVYEGPDIVGGPCSSTAGPVDEFGQVGWEEAKPGGSFIKIGVGALRKGDEGSYDNYRLYEIADPGKWTIVRHRDSIFFTQELADSSSGYGYLYRKTLHLVKGKPEMVLEHSLKNTGTRPIRTTVYNHNFLVLDNQPPGAPLVITVPFQIRTERPPNKELAEIRGNQIVYLKTLEGRDVVTAPLQGFSDSPGDNQIRIESKKLGAGMKITSDRPLARENLWSIRSVIAMEPFVAIAIGPGTEFQWTSTYSYYTLPAGPK